MAWLPLLEVARRLLVEVRNPVKRSVRQARSLLLRAMPECYPESARVELRAVALGSPIQ